MRGPAKRKDAQSLGFLRERNLKVLCYHLAHRMETNQVPQATMNAWIALYVAVGIMVALCATLAVLKTAYDLRSRTLVIDLASWRGRALAAPKLWWRWQLNYLSGAPVILAITLMFAHHLGFATLVDV